jgi:chaperonin GroEL (HSP60 family)
VGTVLIKDEYGTLTITKDGYPVAKAFKELENPIESIGMEAVREVAIKTGRISEMVLLLHIESISSYYFK